MKLGRVFFDLGLTASALGLVLSAVTATAAPLDPNAFSSLGTLNLTSGSLSFDTDTLIVSGGFSGAGVLQSQGMGLPDVAVYTFGDILVGSGVTVQITGSRPVAILSQTDLQIDADLNLSGNDGADGATHADPNAPNGGNGGNGVQGFGGANGAPAPVAAEPGGKGGNGGYNTSSGGIGNPGSGGALGGFGSSSNRCFGITAPGGNGAPGASGPQGPGGIGGPGAVSGPAFALAGGGGTNGLQGQNGKGGGGGGGGIGLGAIGGVMMNGSIIAPGGNGGNGSAGQFGGIGGMGGSGYDDSDPGGIGGNGGDGGPGGGAGGTVYLFGASIHAPSSLVDLSGGTPGTNPNGGVGMAGDAGLLQFEGSLVFDVDSASVFDQVEVDGRIDPAGGVEFHFASEEIADAFATTFTLDSFFVQNGSAVPDVTPFTLLMYSAVSPTRTFDFTLNGDRTFALVIPGDGNGDGSVDGLDYLLWAGNFGDNPADDPPGAPGNGDYNDDGKVDGLDYLVWAGNFGSHAATSVPEPGALTMTLLAFVGLLAIPRRRRG